MLFSSIPFLFYFLPAVLILYFAVPDKLKNGVLLFASLLFYFYGEPVYVLLMIGTTLVSYVFGLLIDRYRGGPKSKIFLVLSIIISVAALGFFKYSDFFIGNVNAVFGSDFKLLRLALPIGISFYTFQVLSYTVDVYRGEAKVQKSFLKLATYVALFPQLIAGPIVRYTTVEAELESRAHTLEGFAGGVGRFVLGLAKKVLIANLLGELCDTFRASDEKSVVFYWIYAIGFSLHIYFDFSGYSDMAIGLGRIFGFKFLENFNYPYISKSIAEFWRRWHISLGSWFRDYIYIPLGGNRVSLVKWLRNIFIVWFLTGFWHGDDWTFIVWGLFFAFFLVMEKLFLGKLLNRLPSFISHIYVIFNVVISFVIFNANGMSEAMSDIAGILGFGNVPFVNSITLYNLRSYAVVLLFAAVGATPLLKNFVITLRGKKLGEIILSVAEPLCYIALLTTVTAYLVDGSFNPFLYFRF